MKERIFFAQIITTEKGTKSKFSDWKSISKFLSFFNETKIKQQKFLKILIILLEPINTSI